jgi:hypothetical protein
MSSKELKDEFEADARFFGWEEGGTLLGVIGIQSIENTALFRHAYRTEY